MKAKTIFDIGMNNGDDTAYYLHKGYNVVAVEANPQLAESVRSRFAHELKEGRLTILNVGIADVEGIIPFWICDRHSEWSSFNREIASRDGAPHHEIRIPTRKFTSILEEFGVPYYLKIDIEGNDELCLNSLKKDALPDYLSVEASDMISVDPLADLGYTRFKCISQYHYLPLEWPPTDLQKRYERANERVHSKNPLLKIVRKLGGRQTFVRQLGESRREGDWTFLFGSSGTFGEHLAGRWQTRDEMCRTFADFRKKMQAREKSPFWSDKEYSFWADIHAAK